MFEGLKQKIEEAVARTNLKPYKENGVMKPGRFVYRKEGEKK